VADAVSKPVPVLDIVLVGAGALGFTSGLMPWYRSTASVLGLQGSVTVNAWDAGPAAWLTVVLLTAAGVVALLRLVGGPGLRTGDTAWRALLPAVLATLAALCLLARWSSWTGSPDEIEGLEGAQFRGSFLNGLVQADAGPDTGFYLAVVAVLVALVSGWLSARTALSRN
jgi:hypothetical protein